MHRVALSLMLSLVACGGEPKQAPSAPPVASPSATPVVTAQPDSAKPAEVVEPVAAPAAPAPGDQVFAAAEGRAATLDEAKAAQPEGEPAEAQPPEPEPGVAEPGAAEPEPAEPEPAEPEPGEPEPEPEPAAPPLSPEAHAADAAAFAKAIKQAFAAWSKGDLDAAVAPYRGDVDWEQLGVTESPWSGVVALKGFWTALRLSFPDARLVARRIYVGAAGQAVVEAAWRGTHKGVFNEREPTGRTVGLETLMFMKRDADGRVSRVYEYTNVLGLLRQLDAAPEKAGPKPEPPDLPRRKAQLVHAAPTPDQAKALSTWRSLFDVNTPKEDIVAAVDPKCVVFDAAAGTRQKGVEAVTSALTGWRERVKGADAAVLQSFQVGPWVLSRLAWRGEHRPPGTEEGRGVPISISLADVSRFEAGKLVETRSYTNHYELADQLGLLPKPSPPEAKRFKVTKKTLGGAPPN